MRHGAGSRLLGLQLFVVWLGALTRLVVAADPAPPSPPVRFWGQVLDAGSGSVSGVTSMFVTVSASAGSRLLGSRDATLITTAGRSFYDLEWPVDDFATAVAGHDPVRLAVVLHPPVAGSIALSLSSTQVPPRIDVLAGSPRLPAHRVVATRGLVTQADGHLVLDLAVLFAGSSATASGRVDWSPQGSLVPVAGEPAILPAAGFSVSHVTYELADDASCPGFFEARWTPDTGVMVPVLDATVALESPVLVVADDLAADGPLPGAALLQAVGSSTRVTDATLQADAGSWITMDMESSASVSDWEGLKSWAMFRAPGAAVDATGRPVDGNALDLFTCTIRPLPGGSTWIHGSWRVTCAMTFAGLELHGPVGHPPPPAFRLRSLRVTRAFKIQEGEW